MTATRCGACGSSVRDAYLCRPCVRDLREKLADLAPGRSLFPVHTEGAAGRGASTRWDVPSAVLIGGLGAHLDTAVMRQARIGAGGGKKGRGEHGPTPFNERAAEIRARLVNLLGPWAVLLLEQERPSRRPPACTHRDPVGADCRTCAVDVPRAHATRVAAWSGRAATVRHGDVAAMAGYLLAHMKQLQAQDDVTRLLTGLRSATRKLEAVIDSPGERLSVGECGAELPNETVCTRQLYADPAEVFVDCPVCETRWTVADRRAWLLAAAEDSLGTAATISTALTRLEQPVTADRIYKWKERGRLKVHGREAPPPCRHHQGIGRQPLACEACAEKEGAPLYRLGDVVNLLVEAAQADVQRARKAAAKVAAKAS